MKNIVNAILAIAYRDITKFRRDKVRILATFIFPFLFVGVLGSSFQANVGDDLGFNFLTFVFTGVLGQVMFQSTASGIISLIEDRKNDFAQELFVTPVSRYVILIGKIVGESSVALIQGLGVVGFGLVMGIPLGLWQLLRMFPAVLAASLLGGSFGLLVLANWNSERSANQVFPFVIFPQFFLAGVFNPIRNLPIILDILSKISPMRYAVDLVRDSYYVGGAEYATVVLSAPWKNALIMGIMFGVFVIAGTTIFVRNERNR